MYTPTRLPPNRPWRGSSPWGVRWGMFGGGPGPTRSNAPSWQMIQGILGGLQGGQQDYQKWISELLGTMGTTARSQLAGGIGSQLGRMNVAIPAGANALANRYMGTLDDQFAMLRQLASQPAPYGQNLAQSLSIGQGLAPSFAGMPTNNMLEKLRELLAITGGRGR
jgi:hypothetical protein